MSYFPHIIKPLRLNCLKNTVYSIFLEIDFILPVNGWSWTWPQMRMRKDPNGQILVQKVSLSDCSYILGSKCIYWLSCRSATCRLFLLLFFVFCDSFYQNCPTEGACATGLCWLADFRTTENMTFYFITWKSKTVVTFT